MNKSKISFSFVCVLMLLVTRANSQSITGETSYAYQSNKHKYPTQIENVRSDGNKDLVIITYPQDYAPGCAFIDTLVARRFYSYPIETVTLTTKGTDLYVTGASITRYGELNGLIESELLVERAEPIPISQYKFSNSSAIGQLPFTNSSTFDPDSRFKTVLTYDLYTYYAKKPVQTTSLGGVSNCYIYDYDDQFLVAEIQNAKLEDVAYTGFDSPSGTDGGWDLSEAYLYYERVFSGTGAFDYGSVKKRGMNPNKVYQVSYWCLHGRKMDVSGCTVLNTDSVVLNNGNINNDWMYVKHTITGGDSIVLSNGYIDELRLLPLGAQMKTYTYESIYTAGSSNALRLAEMGDANGSFIRYEYDAQGRIICIRDSYHNVLETTKYNLLH